MAYTFVSQHVGDICNEYRRKEKIICVYVHMYLCMHACTLGHNWNGCAPGKSWSTRVYPEPQGPRMIESIADHPMSAMIEKDVGFEPMRTRWKKEGEKGKERVDQR